MPKQLENAFSSYEFSEEEYPIAVTFTELQRLHIRNELSVAAAEKLALAFDPANPLSFQMEHEYIRGKIEILTYLLTVHEDMQSAAAAIARDAANNQADNN